MRKTVVLTAAVFFAAFAYPAMAQISLEPGKVVGRAPGQTSSESKTDQPKAYEPAAQPQSQKQQQPPASQPKESQTANDCRVITISIPGLGTKEPSVYSVTILDSKGGLVADLQACNKKAAVQKFESDRSAVIRVTQTQEGVAYLDIPVERANRLICRFTTTATNWPLQERDWNCGGPIGSRTAITLQPGAPWKQAKRN